MAEGLAEHNAARRQQQMRSSLAVTSQIVPTRECFQENLLIAKILSV